MRFEWDGAKARANWRKHGVSLEEAIIVFSDVHVRDGAASGKRLVLKWCRQLGG